MLEVFYFIIISEMNIVITGVSRGIGLELVKLFAKEHTVYCLSRNIEPIKSLGNKNVKYLSFDFLNKDYDGFEIFFREIEGVDVLINNAGLLYNKPFSTIKEEELRSIFDVNVLGPFWLIQQLFDKIVRQNGHIINIGSMGGVQGSVKFPGLSAYSSSKGALAILTECLAEEYKEESITINCLALGAVQTEMLEQAFPGYVAPLSPSEMAEYIFDFAIKGKKYYNGKVLPLSLSTP